ncbi:hypothetical protein M3936_03465 [Sutcliffiella horikoshii]|uniref:hypothetical protein n=1 Tax=Sutcliffiella horikoshii TaxID=79883 RepID=UPI00203FE855|nr:hypothetical protein [Sutcliffiella horikoshii]MCM3616635.1 hypothetical protein [Sutcliffiella horikoshii]
MEINVFKGLLRKEWLLLRNTFLLLICSMLFIWVVGFGWSLLTGNADILLLFTTMIIVAHVLYVTWIVGAGLNMEEKSQLWLHNPNSTMTLLGSKLFTGIYLQIISILVALLLLVITVNLSVMEMIGQFELETLTIQMVFSVVIQVVVSGLELGMYYMFFWSIYHGMGRFHKILKFRVVLFIAFIILFITAMNYLESYLLTGFETVLPVPIEMGKFMGFYIEGDGISVSSDGETTTLANIIISIIKAAGLFYLSSLLLNKAVEVK